MTSSQNGGGHGHSPCTAPAQVPHAGARHGASAPSRPRSTHGTGSMQSGLIGSHTASPRMLTMSIEIDPGEASSSNAGQPGTPSLPSVSPVAMAVATIDVAPAVVVEPSVVSEPMPGVVEPVSEEASDVAPVPQAVTVRTTSSERQANDIAAFSRKTSTRQSPAATWPPWCTLQHWLCCHSMANETSTTTVGEHMTPVAYSVGDDQTLAEASLRMRDLDVRHLPVMRGSRLVGIVSERDIAILKARSTAYLDELRVSDAMTRDPYHVPSKTPLSEVARTMGIHRYGATVIVDDGEIKGIFSTTDGMLALARLSG